MTDITELAQREKFEAWAEERCALPWGYLKNRRTNTGYFSKHDYTSLWAAWKAAGTELVEALEKAQQRIDELQQGFIANQEEAHEAIKYATELKEQLARACASREDAFREVDEMQKSLDHTHRRRAIWRGGAVTAEAEIASLRQRIAELEREYEHLRPVGVMSEKAFHRLENSESRFIALWPRPGIFLPRKRPEDGVIVYARTAAPQEVKGE